MTTEFLYSLNKETTIERNTESDLESIAPLEQQQRIKNNGLLAPPKQPQSNSKGSQESVLRKAAQNKYQKEACDKTNANQLIDSRSILTNKAKLKRFWEEKMELELKLKEGEVGAGKTFAEQANETFDENNNNFKVDKLHEVQSFSDEEWKSLSPNVEPSAFKLKNAKQQVSAELVCEKLRKYQKNEEADEQQLQPMSIDPALCRMLPKVDRDGDREEQTANEEFSSSSNSSFGPVSITLTTSKQEPAEDEEDSTQSGSVLTVIEKTKNDDVSADESGSSNLGVAFESLQFDTEIKSSRDEQVEEAPAPRALPAKRFSANEVKSVCSFISAAISDADRQVEASSKRSLVETDPDSGSSSIQRATFVQEQEEEEEEELPKADLSSIFEANVRREIERFEIKSSSGAANRLNGTSNKLAANKSGLTEWRIAEEIRLFNEREMELKQRTAPSKAAPNKRPTLGQQTNNEPNDAKQRTEAIVRFGKTLQLPRPSAEGLAPQAGGKGIKLSTTSVGSSHTTTISMHKFIASGGKRFVFTSTSSGGSSNSSSSSSLLLTKSMSNLSTLGKAPGKQVDYKAADSLNFKETPNVKPGSARKVIESFSRLSSEHVAKANDEAARVPNLLQPKVVQASQIQSQSQFGAGSAEWKIQEELREMREREAELRSQRSGGLERKTKLETNCSQADNNCNNVVEPVKVVDESSAEESEFSSESLYPIKQTIDSFRKLNSQSGGAPQTTTTSTSAEKKRQIRAEQRQAANESAEAASDDNYDSKVGGQRRKISIIERWENGISSSVCDR